MDAGDSAGLVAQRRRWYPTPMSGLTHGQAFYEHVNAVLPPHWRIEPAPFRELRLVGPDGGYAEIGAQWLSDGALLKEEAVGGAIGVLNLVQQEIAEQTTEPWPARSGPGYPGFPEPDAEIEGDQLTMWFGDRTAPALSIEPVDLSEVLLTDP
jgi:hypothetical protein